MGWTFNVHESTKQDFIINLTRNRDNAIYHKVSVRGNHVWCVYEGFYTNKETNERCSTGKFIILYLISSNKKCWGYKDISEDMYPAYYDCPKGFIKLVDPIDSQWANEWRMKVFGKIDSKGTTIPMENNNE